MSPSFYKALDTPDLMVRNLGRFEPTKPNICQHLIRFQWTNSLREYLFIQNQILFCDLYHLDFKSSDLPWVVPKCT